MFRTDLLSIISSPNTVFTATGICHTSYVDCLLARPGWSSVPSWPDENKVEKEYISLAFIIRMYNDARSSGCQMLDSDNLSGTTSAN